MAGYTTQQILRYIEGKAVGEKLTRKIKKAQEAEEEEGYYEDEPLTEEEMREAVADDPSTESEEKTREPKTIKRKNK